MDRFLLNNDIKYLSKVIRLLFKYTMKILHIKVQQSLLIINNKVSTAEVIREIQGRCNHSNTQISIFNSEFDQVESKLEVAEQV